MDRTVGLTSMLVGTMFLTHASPALAGVPVVDEFSGIMNDLAAGSEMSGTPRSLFEEGVEPDIARAVIETFEARLQALRQAEAALAGVAAMPTSTPEELAIALDAAVALRELVTETVLVVTSDIELDIGSPKTRLMLLTALEERTDALEQSTRALTNALESRARTDACDKSG
ncbi:MAG: hypothetical protein Tsb008_05440 [Rhodothalassiaceae bacterium]